MNALLIFFAIPLAVIIFSIALQKIFKCPILVAAIVFAILLIVTFAAFTSDFLVLAIIYTLLAFITATFVCVLCQILRQIRRRQQEDEDDDISDEKDSCSCSCGCGCRRLENLATTTRGNERMGNCGCYRRR